MLVLYFGQDPLLLWGFVTLEHLNRLPIVAWKSRTHVILRQRSGHIRNGEHLQWIIKRTGCNNKGASACVGCILSSKTYPRNLLRRTGCTSSETQVGTIKCDLSVGAATLWEHPQCGRWPTGHRDDGCSRLKGRRKEGQWDSFKVHRRFSLLRPV
ncbi:hypothetical protein AN958_00483 [Leucoagaricus sp. SymC.cos]|nr:hypothetical protein AN958_00483 [Leucoagaricus sp. SymC.cos]